MLKDFSHQICIVLERSGYLIDLEPRIPGVSALAYIWSRAPKGMGFARVDDYILIVDGEYPPYLTEGGFREAYGAFSAFANQTYRVPHSLRMRIPNLAIVALSKKSFTPEILRFTRFTSLNPWYGGETGQVILVELENETEITLSLKSASRYPVPGALPLGHAQELIRAACQSVWKAERAAPASTPTSTTSR
jgi:hypothetical protein